MKLRGVLDKSLGNFLCLRGYAKMGDLYNISEAKDYQRGLDQKHKREVAAFVDRGKFHFYPEVVLGATLATNEAEISLFNRIFSQIDSGEKFNSTFGQMTLQSYFNRTKSAEEGRVYDYFCRGLLIINNTAIRSGKLKKLSRIDGNHRLSIISPTKQKFKNINIPFCIVFFRDESDAEKYGAALFHNINYKAKPLTMEDNLRLILGNTELFPDDDLKSDPSFGWAYYLARKLYGNIDYDMTPDINNALHQEERVFLVEELSWLIQEEILGENESAIRRFKQAIAVINTLYSKYQQLSGSKNRGLLGAFVYYQLQPEKLVNSFAEWVIDNHIHTIEKSHSKDLAKVFDSILESRKRTIFVAMPFEKDKTDNHYEMINRVVEEINTEYSLRIKIKVDRIDGIVKGKSYEINNEILKMISNCGLLIGDLTYCNPNVYHEIGFLMGKSRALGEGFGEMLLFLDESVRKEDRFVGFNLKGIKQLRFKRLKIFAQQLKRHLVKFFDLKQIV